MASFKDHFSGHAERYGAYRPHYPGALFAYLASVVPRHGLAWDCATGNGQAARALAPYFDSIVATDASRKQIEQAPPHERVSYVVATAERSMLPDNSVDLVTVAQALHWLDLPKFSKEVQRVCKADGILAVWCYQLHTITPEIDVILHRLYEDILGTFWPPERRVVEVGYKGLVLPFAEELTAPTFEMAIEWDLQRVANYIDTWSSSQRYQATHHADAFDLIRSDLEAAWGDPEQPRRVTWPLFVRLGRIQSR